MKKYITLAGLGIGLLFALPAQAQITKEEAKEVSGIVQQNASYTGGQDALVKYMKKNFTYPKSAQEKSIEGRAFVRFVIEKDGSVEDATIARGVTNCPDCDAEALRLIKNMPKWIPARQDENPVRVYFTMPVVFKLTK